MNIQVVNSDNSMSQISQGSVTQSGQTAAVQANNSIAYKIASSVRYMNTGDTFTGQITGMDGSSIEILLSDKSVIDAKLAGQMNLQVGQSMSFEVTSSAGGKIQLTPLYANLAGDSQVARALNAAELPVTPRMSEMVQSMMEEGMSIDSRSLLDMAKSVNNYPSAAPSSIVQMTHFNMQINDESVAQYELYRNNSHQIASEVTGLAGGYADIAGESVTMNQALLNIFTGSTDGNAAAALKMALSGSDPFAAGTQDESSQGEAAVPVQEDTASPESVQSGQTAADAAVSGNLKQKIYREDTVTTDLNALFTPQEKAALAGKMNALGIPETITSHVSDGSVSTSQTLEYIKAAFEQLSKNSADPDRFLQNFKELTGSSEYGKLLKNEISGQMLLAPEEVADKEKVKEYFENVVRDTARVTELLNSAGRGDTTLAKGTSQLHDNVDFMNQMNQMFTYMQLPLKLNQQAAHGELYVYTNKKRLASKDGSVSALLHLDMEHLGTMDVHVSMNAGGNVKTHFIMQKEEMLDFIAGHLPELDERLKKRGYNMTSDVSLNKESKTVPEIMFSQGSNARLVQHTAFDVKA